MDHLLRLLVIVTLWSTSEACHGYKLHVRKLENCGNNDVLKLRNFNLTLTDDCFVIPSGWIENEKEIVSANGKLCNNKNKRVEIKKNKSKLAYLLGEIQATIEIETNVGYACLEFHGMLTKIILPKLPTVG